MKNIREFKKGDAIVRVEPAKPYPSTTNMFGVTQDGVRDRSGIGEKVIFLGIANAQIYFKRTDPFELLIFGDKLCSYDLDLWDEGWDYYQEPEIFLSDSESKLSIEAKIKAAIEKENYELAEKLRRSL